MPEQGFSDRLRLLQLETLYDLALALHEQRGEQVLVEELLQRVAGVLDPAAAVAGRPCWPSRCGARCWPRAGRWRARTGRSPGGRFAS
jgi:hypothetical protein